MPPKTDTKRYVVYRTTFEGTSQTQIAGVTILNNKETELDLTDEQHSALKADKTITALALVKDADTKESK